MDTTVITRWDSWCLRHQQRHIFDGGLSQERRDASCQLLSDSTAWLKGNLCRLAMWPGAERHMDFCQGCFMHDSQHVNGRCLILAGEFRAI